MRLYVFSNHPDAPNKWRTGVIPTDQRAEELMKFFAQDIEDDADVPTVFFVLCDDQGIRCVWRRSVEDADAKQLPALVKATARFSDDMRPSTSQVTDIIDPEEWFERAALDRHFRL